MADPAIDGIKARLLNIGNPLTGYHLGSQINLTFINTGSPSLSSNLHVGNHDKLILQWTVTGSSSGSILGGNDGTNFAQAWLELQNKFKVFFGQAKYKSWIGHLDYVVRYGKSREKEYSYTDYADIIDEILKLLIEKEKGLEVNSAGLKYGLPFAHPHPDVLNHYRELGGEIITIGADAHKPEHIAYDFAKAEEILKSCGFKYYTEFFEQKPVFKQLI